MEKNQKGLGYFFAAISVFFWGITFVCTKYLLRNFSSLEILFYRFIAAYLGLWLIHPKFEKIAVRDNILYALAGLTGVVLYQLTENIAIHFTNASNVSVIVSICPLFTAILSQIFLKEKHLSFC
jgi:drug/metabolite transporter (DMT)-like permease